MAIWFEYVPSKANVADLPTRPCRASYAFLRALGARRIALVLPPFPAWDESPAFWMDRGVAVAEGAARAAELHEQVGAEGASRALPPSPAAAAPILCPWPYHSGQPSPLHAMRGGCGH